MLKHEKKLRKKTEKKQYCNRISYLCARFAKNEGYRFRP
jgi:hypothetical protein